jgi:hypothetical protein
MKGACSIPDGAGFLRLNSDSKEVEKFDVDREYLMAIVENEMSHDSIRRLLQSALQEKNDNAWIEEVYDGFFIYEDGGKLYRQTFTTEQNRIALGSGTDEVVRVTEYRTIDGIFVGNDDGSHSKEFDMDKEKLVKALIDNEKTHWAEDDHDGLMALSEDTLKTLEADATKEPEPETNDDDKGTEKPPVAEEPTDTEPVGNKDEKPMTTEEYIANAPEGVREVLTNGMAMMKREKEKLIEAITANERNTFEKSYLEKRSLDELTAIANLAVAETKDDTGNPTPNYRGQGPVSNSHKEDALPLPVMNFAKD